MNDIQGKIRIGISTCLLGENVRYDGGHKRDRFIIDTLGRWCDFVPVCPEVECGLSTPREAVRLVGNPDDPRLKTRTTGIDHTERMKTWGRRRLDNLAPLDLVAYIFKGKSPSSGPYGIKVYKEDGNVMSRSGVGLWARAFIERFPDIPIIDEGRLHDPGLRENFIETIFVMQRWRAAVSDRRKGLGPLVDFHSRHKYLLMARSPEKLRVLGRIVANHEGLPTEEVVTVYRTELIALLRLKKTRKKNVNVLQHMLGYFKKDLTSDEKAELLETIRRYGDDQVPLIVPLTLVNHYVRKYRQSYLSEQVYLNPHPAEMGLLNHV